MAPTASQGRDPPTSTASRARRCAAAGFTLDAVGTYEDMPWLAGHYSGRPTRQFGFDLVFLIGKGLRLLPKNRRPLLNLITLETICALDEKIGKKGVIISGQKNALLLL